MWLIDQLYIKLASILTVIQTNVGGLVQIPKQPTVGYTPTVVTYCR